MGNDYTGFWLELADFSNSHEDPARYWNGYLHWRYGEHLRWLLGHPWGTDQEEADKFLENWKLLPEEKNQIEAFARRFGNQPPRADDEEFSYRALMDFSGIKSPIHQSFAGKYLLNANFDGVAFAEKANFCRAIFVGFTSFEGAKFKQDVDRRGDKALFEDALFHGHTSFKSAKFGRRVKFDRAIFRSHVFFDDAEFGTSTEGNKERYGKASFANVRFEGTTLFANAEFRFGASFEEAVFGREIAFHTAVFEQSANFTNTRFMGKTVFTGTRFEQVSFNNAQFLGSATFRNVSFGKPPKFFETALHEDTEFDEIDSSRAEQSYGYPWWRCKPSDPVRQAAGEATRAWDRLALMMSKQGKSWDRHKFYRLRMRAQRRRDGWNILSLANWVFDVSSDYGWDVARAFFWWLSQLVVGGAIVVAAVVLTWSSVEVDYWSVVWNSLMLSFANSHAFFGLTSKGGYLASARVELMQATSATWILDAIGTCQTVLGPIMLFLLLLTLRNRFRIG